VSLRQTGGVAYEFRLPDLGEGLTEGEITRWLVGEGQEIGEDDPLVEIQTDKTTVEIPSPAAGTVARILAAEGDVVPVGTVIVVIGGAAEAPVRASEPTEAAPTNPEAAPERTGPSTGRVRATPLVRRVAQELGVDLERVAGTGPQGRVTEEDVRGATADGDRRPSAGEGRREPIRGIRRVMAENMARAQEIPAVTWVDECDFTGVDLRRLVALALSAAAHALRDFPELNARVEGDELVLLDRYDIGIAVQTDDGLVVPVVRGCDTASPDDIDAEVRRLADAAHAGRLAPEELRGATFTVTSAGKHAGLLGTPLINPPQTGILGLHRIADRPVVRDGSVAVRSVGNVSVTFDHRVVYGKRAAEFGLDVIRRLESGT
jgi:pyruvate/2-oxoglutarate dehydrogenase complex dihydrolipoamide acyltransferase (E2) component